MRHSNAALSAVSFAIAVLQDPANAVTSGDSSSSIATTPWPFERLLDSSDDLLDRPDQPGPAAGPFLRGITQFHGKIAGQFAARTIAMLESPAYRVLSQSAHRALARIEIELAHHGGTDNGKLPVTFDNFVDYGMDRHSIAPALRELVALGFVEITERGRAGNAEWRAPNRFRLTYKHTGRASGTDEWKRIESLEEAQALARAARRAVSSARRTKSQCVNIPNPSASIPHCRESIKEENSASQP